MLTNDLNELIEQFNDSKLHVKKLISGLNKDELNKRPAADKWSAAECIRHLISVGTDYVKAIEDKLEQALIDGNTTDKKLKFSLIGKPFTKYLEPPVNKKFKTPEIWEPNSAEDPDKLIEAYSDLQNLFIRLLEKAKGYNISKYKVNSPASKIIKINLLDAFNVNAAHQRRHLWQAENVIKEIK